MKTETARRNGIVIMAKLIVLLGKLSGIMLLAVINGSLGFLCAMGVGVAGAAGIAKAAGAAVPLSYPALMAIAIGCGVCRGLLRYIEQYFNHYIAFRLLAVLRDKVFAALRKLYPAKMESREKGAIISMLTADIETLEVFYAHTISPICIAVIVSSIVLAFVSAVSSWKLALCALAGYLIIGIAVPMVFSSRTKAAGVRYRQEFSSFNAFFLDSIKGVKDIILYNDGPKRLAEISRRSDRLLAESAALKKETTKAAAFTELTVSAVILVSALAAIALTYTGEISVGQMIIGLAAVFGSFGPVLAVAALPGNLAHTLASADRVISLLEEQPVFEEVHQCTEAEFSEFEIKNLSFGYEEGRPILKDVSLSARPGEIIGISGKSGSGKSTLLKLLLKFRRPSQGNIAFDGMDANLISSEDLRRNVVMVSQSAYLFDDTIEENLRIARPDATDEELMEACKAASVYQLIQSLPEGFQTRVGSLQDRLSAGEKQRIGLARAFLSEAKVILLDEPTSNVDAINEGMILSALEAHKEGRCIILVSHRPSTMKIADRICHMEKGRLASCPSA